MKKRRFFYGMLLFLAGAALTVACSKDNDNDDDGSSGNNNTATVFMTNTAFSVASLQVKTGATVTWKNNDNMAHTVTANDNSFDSGDMQPGASFSHTFNSTGTFTYYCRYHAGMTATVVVIAQ